MQFKPRALKELGNLICGNFEAADSVFVYRSSSALTEFFEDCDIEYVHDGSTACTGLLIGFATSLTVP